MFVREDACENVTVASSISSIFPAGPRGPTGPWGIVKLNTGSFAVPVFVTSACVPGSPVVVFPIVIVLEKSPSSAACCILCAVSFALSAA